MCVSYNSVACLYFRPKAVVAATVRTVPISLYTRSTKLPMVNLIASYSQNLVFEVCHYSSVNNSYNSYLVLVYKRGRNRMYVCLTLSVELTDTPLLINLITSFVSPLLAASCI